MAETLFENIASTNHIVAIESLGDVDNKGAMYRVFYRTGELETSYEDIPFRPFLFLRSEDSLDGWRTVGFETEPLSGDNYYRALAHFDSWDTLWKALDFLNERPTRAGQTHLSSYLVNDRVSQFQMAHEITLFKGMSFDDVHRMQIDIEVYSAHGFPNASNADDRIIIISMLDNRGWQVILSALDFEEPELLEAMIGHVLERDPDVIEGHNIFKFDLEYIRRRCERYGIDFQLGRAGGKHRYFQSAVRFAERMMSFPAVDIPGRHVIDTFFLALEYDVSKRDLPGYGLKDIAKHFGVASSNRTYIDGDKIAETWLKDPDTVLSYALDDVIETKQISERLSGAHFYMAQQVPVQYGRLARSGPGIKIETLFLSQYLKNRTSVSRPGEGRSIAGGYTALYYQGVLEPVVYADVESLYPSIMLAYDIKPASDILGVFQSMLRELTDLRLSTKRRMQDETDPLVKDELDARQTSYKILINAFYGYLGFSLALFNDFDAAERVTLTGQRILKSIIIEINKTGGVVAEVDTDGVFFKPPEGASSTLDYVEYVDQLNERLPEGIRLNFEGSYRKMLSYKIKNYALLDAEGNLSFKGSSLISRSIEKFGRDFVQDCVLLLMQGDVEGLHKLYLQKRDNIIRHEWESVDDFSRSETLHDDLDSYREDVEAGNRQRAASYEVAIANVERNGTKQSAGDKIQYYIAHSTGQNAAVRSPAFEVARSADLWDPENPDEDTTYYLRRLDEFASKFEPFFNEHHFRQVFSEEDLFGFDATGIEVLGGSVDIPLAKGTEKSEVN